MPSAKRSKKRRSNRSASRQPTRPSTGATSRPTGSTGGSGGAAAAGRRPTGQDAELARQRAERRRHRLILGAVVGGLVLVVVGAAIGVQTWISQRSPQPPETAQPEFGPVPITDGEPIVLGSDDAPVTLGLYEDVKCPHCADLEETLGATITDLLRDGTIKVELYPMAIVAPDGASTATANALACAAADGFGTGYHAGLFANTRLSWSDAQLIELGALVGEPSAEFAECIRTDAHQGWVDSIGRAAEEAGITGTPAVFINGSHKPDAPEWTPDDFRDQIQAAQ